MVIFDEDKILFKRVTIRMKVIEKQDNIIISLSPS